MFRCCGDIFELAVCSGRTALGSWGCNLYRTTILQLRLIATTPSVVPGKCLQGKMLPAGCYEALFLQPCSFLCCPSAAIARRSSARVLFGAITNRSVSAFRSLATSISRLALWTLLIASTTAVANVACSLQRSAATSEIISEGTIGPIPSTFPWLTSLPAESLTISPGALLTNRDLSVLVFPLFHASPGI
jgi:hypothetical protein